MIRRGEVYFVNLDPTKGREQKGSRPVLVVSSDAVNANPLVVVVIPGTNATHIPKDYPVNVRVPREESGLESDTVFLGFQVRALDPGRFVRPSGQPATPAGVLTPEAMARVDDALRLVLGL